ncbi:hypothetical protein BT63DRAFT_428607 [Microthyrium microscopicum]|uniref:Uncharacterized protein n=1 Tax=Microthyrium microscopicum TaxID=703497 RepID=A0A6A6U3Y1_9PEZI|nr:hypothetical protein BT63DRAFT_428607 [Microthyrium microscopicum]
MHFATPPVDLPADYWLPSSALTLGTAASVSLLACGAGARFFLLRAVNERWIFPSVALGWTATGQDWQWVSDS